MKDHITSTAEFILNSDWNTEQLNDYFAKVKKQNDLYHQNFDVDKRWAAQNGPFSIPHIIPSGCDLRGVDFSGLDLRDVYVEKGVIIDPITYFNGVKKGTFSMPDTIPAGFDLRGVDFSGLDLSEVNFGKDVIIDKTTNFKNSNIMVYQLKTCVGYESLTISDFAEEQDEKKIDILRAFVMDIFAIAIKRPDFEITKKALLRLEEDLELDLDPRYEEKISQARELLIEAISSKDKSSENFISNVIYEIKEYFKAIFGQRYDQLIDKTLNELQKDLKEINKSYDRLAESTDSMPMLSESYVQKIENSRKTPPMAK